MSAATQKTLEKRLHEAELVARGEDYYEIFFRSLGSECHLFYHAENQGLAERFRNAAFTWLSRFEAKFSRFLPDSELSRANALAGKESIQTDGEWEVLLDLCAHCHFVTEGAFDATSLPLSLLWDWKRKHDTLPDAVEIKAALLKVGWSKVEREPGRLYLPHEGMMLDFGGIGKEFAVDCVKQLAESLGIDRILVDLGGDIAVHGDSPEGDGWYVGLEDPERPGESFCGIRLRGGASVATSGDYRRCFQLDGHTYGHILDCRTGWPVANGTRSVTVVAPRCLMAGLLSTSAMVLGGRDAIDMLDRTEAVEGCLWCNHELLETRGFRTSILPRQFIDKELPHESSSIH